MPDNIITGVALSREYLSLKYEKTPRDFAPSFQTSIVTSHSSRPRRPAACALSRIASSTVRVRQNDCARQSRIMAGDAAPSRRRPPTFETLLGVLKRRRGA